MLVELLGTSPEQHCPEGAVTTAEPGSSLTCAGGTGVGDGIFVFLWFFALLSQLLSEGEFSLHWIVLSYTEFFVTCLQHPHPQQVVLGRR